MPDTSDQEILLLIRNESTRNRGFEILVRKYQQKVYYLIRRMVLSHDDADDISQDVFVKVWENIHNFREESKLFTWIYRIATNEALNFLKQSERKRIMSEGAGLPSTSVSQDPYFSGDEIQAKFYDAIRLLPPRQQLVFNLKYFEELKYEEISDILNVSTGALKASYHHAVKKIMNFLDPG
ncbi:MAG: RNA polymerase sigma factor [Bacteroidetes bacterium]|nr:RNA polymerase sigma factor [Bacteroidota bacterium]